MSKEAKGADYSHITPELVSQVDEVIADSVKHNYHASKIYAAHNAVFKRQDKPQTCGSCVRNRVRDLKKWKAEYLKDTAAAEEPVIEFKDRENVKEYTNVETGEKAHYEAIDVTDEGFRLLDEEGQNAPDGEYSYEGATTPAIVIDGYTLTPEPVAPQYTDPDAPGYVPQAEDIVRYPMAEGIPFDFLPNEGTLVKGSVTLGDGSKVKPGTYVTAEGLKIVVQPGGKATIKNENGEPFEDDLT